MTSINSIQSIVLDLPPSCIEFCTAAPALFVVGTYFLERREQDESAAEDGPKEAQRRTGSLIVVELDGDEVISKSTTATPYAVLDAHFCPHDAALLCVAASTGVIEFFRLETTTATLVPEKTIRLFEPEVLVLSLAWHPLRADVLGVTASSGEVVVCELSLPSSSSSSSPFSGVEGLGQGEGEVQTATRVTEVQKHDLEAWTLAFSRSGTAVFSGGDDAALRFCGGALGAEGEGLGIQWFDRRSHGAGVTAILPLAGEEDIVVTGSYDDCIRVLRAPQIGRKEVLAEENLEGGVWRLKMLHEDHGGAKYLILASCMHAGARIVEIERDAGDQWRITVLAKFEEHKSMNYGSDVRPGNSETKTIVSTSFYDKLLCLWRYEKD